MARKRRSGKQGLNPDPKYKSLRITQFVNCLFRQGKKSTGEQIFYSALDTIKERTGDEGIEVFEKAIDNVRPMVQVRSRRVGGQTYQIPVEVRHDERLALSIRWLVSFAKQRGEKTMAAKLAGEFIDASTGQGRAIQRREETHRMAEANRAFAHYRW
ncbi:MAG: 30S ribosomal protein S7 [Candidatus Latescibacterota bacterium]|nr:30S ribosomal protein S7 [Candidatus Latescibacterota bacterium]